MLITMENLSFRVMQTRLDTSGDIDILDEDVLEMLSGIVYQRVVKAVLVYWEEEWSMVVWWEAPEEDWQLLANTEVFAVLMVIDENEKGRG